MAQFPVAPRYAKMLALGAQKGCLPYVLALVSALSVQQLLVEMCAGGGGGEGEGEGEEDGKALARWARVRRTWAGKVSGLVGMWKCVLFLGIKNP